jgi:hypothetical protein
VLSVGEDYPQSSSICPWLLSCTVHPFLTATDIYACLQSRTYSFSSSSSFSMALQPGVGFGLHPNTPPNLSIPCSTSPFVYSHLSQVRRHVIHRFSFLCIIFPISVLRELFVCKCVMYCCHRVSTQLRLNICVYISYIMCQMSSP